MEVLVYIGLGMVVGLLARAILPAPTKVGPIAGMVAGLIGGYLGGVLGDRNHGGTQFSLDATGLILSVVLALVAVAALAFLDSRRSHA
ncbi:hypothetical protein FGE12_11545 [Aggregicoccus sp. 17bor-14]|uniref:GlsB/YeaQ/YmgE family stress response membrane protein n=1 Tax=Myxococcaceae TaxID=31 RepID=UPI00129C7755|nr:MULTISPECIES: hypothetical protein [Myxococcaceae]MBF5043020.1 hypothetical protein [Simulacricoccus sp. 17bor-14]MRI88784.1 hypothetical protein [Aggregicoccus sp. 17bor-14]